MKMTINGYSVAKKGNAERLLIEWAKRQDKKVK